MDVPVYDTQGQEVDTMTIDEHSLGGVINPHLIKQAYVRYHANTRQGSARIKSRGQVAFTGAKMYRQKGTGRARHGDKGSNIFRKGAHAFGKHKVREEYRLDMPKKMRRKANRNALLAKLIDSEVRVVDDLGFDEPKTRRFEDLLRALGVDHRVLVALGGGGEREHNARLSARNVADVTLCRAEQLTCFEMLNHRYLVIGRRELEAWLSGPSSQTDKQAKISPMGASRASAGGEA